MNTRRYDQPDTSTTWSENVEISIDGSVPQRRSVSVTGEIDADNCQQLGSVLLDENAGIAAISLDLGAVSFLDSSALSELLRVKAELDSKNIGLSMTTPSDQVRRVLEITGLLKTFNLE